MSETWASGKSVNVAQNLGMINIFAQKSRMAYVKS